MLLMLTTSHLLSNCSTIQMMVALEPVRQKWDWTVSSYRLIKRFAGAGMGAILETQRELREVLNDVNPRLLHAEILPSGGDKKHYPIAFNALPQIDVFTENDYTYEEMEMTNETKESWKTLALQFQQQPYSVLCSLKVCLH